MPRTAILWVGVITLLIAIYYTWQEVQRTSICDTTYIYEGYADVTLPSDITTAFPRYKLVRYNDNAPHLQNDIATLRHQNRDRHRPIPLLFVHGHLGSPQQMRSMASETSREVIRRYKFSSKDWNIWLDWYAVDFNTEPSALEPQLLEEQSKFVAACLQHLSQNDDTLSSSDLHPLLLVGYSMGGLVAEAALEHLENNIIQRMALVLTLGAPRHHVPSFLRPFRSRIKATKPSNSSLFPLKSSFYPPSVHILSGPGDMMIPGLSSWASIWKNNNDNNNKKDRTEVPLVATVRGTNPVLPPIVQPIIVQVDMDDVPGVWCTASHKGMISCNQLVRQTVPLLVDAAVRAVTISKTEKQQGESRLSGGGDNLTLATTTASVAATGAAATGLLAGLKMTTSLLKGMPETVHETQALLKEVRDVIDQRKLCLTATTSSSSSSSDAECQSIKLTTAASENKQVDNFIFTRQFQRKEQQQEQRQQKICYIWDAEVEEEYKDIKNASLFFIFSGLVPGAEFRVFTEISKRNEKEVDGFVDRVEVDVSSLARPLPSMMEDYPSASEATSKRPWHVVLAGVDWMQNSTRILNLPFGSSPESFTRIKLEINLPLPEKAKNTQQKTIIYGSTGAKPTFIAQVSTPAAAQNTFTKRAFKNFNTLHLEAGNHPLALRLDTITGFSIQNIFSISLLLPASTSAARLVLEKLTQIVVGQALPFRIKSTTSHCVLNEDNIPKGTGTAAPEHDIPILIAVDGGGYRGRKQTQHSRNTKFGSNNNAPAVDMLVGDVVRKAQYGLPLWHPSVTNRDIWFISDPRCNYTISPAWDLGPWMSYTIRYHAYAIIPLVLALSLLELVPRSENKGNNIVVLRLPLVVLLPALSSVWPEYAIALLGKPPWLPLSSIDVCLLGCVAYTVFAMLKFSVSTSQKILALGLLKIISYPRITPSNSKLNFIKWSKIFIYIGVGLSSSVHPAMPALLGVLALLISCTCAETSTPSTPSFKQSWLVTHIIASLPAGIWAFGWITSGRSHSYAIFTLERVFMLIQGAHSCTTAFTTTTPASPITPLGSFLYDRIHLFLAVFVAFSGLWGSLHVVVPVMAIICGLEFVLIALKVQRQESLGKKKRR